MGSFIDDEGGKTAIEYALIASMMTMILAGVLSELRGSVGSFFVG
ncbi:hypothetical protein LBMAG42_37260 [Deltaproteobacteria bacterium]|nr:hypothetical protein LBMAG42_37260 [Deltaproteobacteria bacterium]